MSLQFVFHYFIRRRTVQRKLQNNFPTFNIFIIFVVSNYFEKLYKKDEIDLFITSQRFRGPII